MQSIGKYFAECVSVGHTWELELVHRGTKPIYLIENNKKITAFKKCLAKGFCGNCVHPPPPHSPPLAKAVFLYSSMGRHCAVLFLYTVNIHALYSIFRDRRGERHCRQMPLASFKINRYFGLSSLNKWIQKEQRGQVVLYTRIRYWYKNSFNVSWFSNRWKILVTNLKKCISQESEKEHEACQL